VFQRTGSSRAVLASILSSDTYFRTIGGGTSAGYVAALYAKILGRGVDPSAQGWVDQLNRGASR
jgi:Domain of unknown function (DUF4214)